MAVSNNVTLNTDFNVSPYYDDFNEDKNYHRILFRPGLAVQARELTQLQTMLQNQVDRFGEHIFKEGSVVAGLESVYDNNFFFVKVRDNDASGTPLVANTFNGLTIRGATSNVYAIVQTTLSGAEAEDPDLNTLYVKYINPGSNTTASNTYFTLGEQIFAVSNSSITANVASGTSSVGIGSAVTIDSGILFAKDHFIKVPRQTLVLGKYSPNTSFRIGYELNESIVNSDQDTTLLDPAQGAYNYAAPGADRLKIQPVLTKYVLGSSTSANFVEILQIKQGVVQERFDRPQYSDIRDYLAKRTYEVNGNFHVSGMAVRLREHLNQNSNFGAYSAAQGGDVNKLSVDIDPGLAYVNGYDINTIVTKRVPIQKATDYVSIEQAQVAANYGNYVSVNEVSGIWDVNTHTKVNLYDAPAKAVSNTTFSSAATQGNLAGTARVRALEYQSGTKGSAAAKYNLYLYDIQMTANSFSNVRSVYLNNSTSATSNAVADIVVSTSNTAVLQEASFNRSLFKIPANSIKTIRDTGGNVDTNFQFVKKFDITIASDGTATVLTGDSSETFPFSTGALNATQKRDNFYLVLNGLANNSTSVATGTMSNGANSVTGITDASTKFNIGDRIKFQSYANTFTVSSVGATSLSTIEPALAPITANTILKQFYPGQVIDLSGVGGDNASRSVTIDSTTQATIDIQETLNSSVGASLIVELNKVDGQEKAKLYRSNRYVQVTVNRPDGTANTTGPWNLGISDVHRITDVRLKTGNTLFTAVSEGSNVTPYFFLDNGQKDNYYDHAKLKVRQNVGFTPSAGDVYLVKLNYFAESTTQGKGYFSVDSYPIDDANSSNTTAITTQEIPVFTSPVTGVNYNLRDSIDIRPRVTDTATDSITVAGATVNPASNNTFVSPAGGLRYMAPNENMTMDLDYYLARRDVLSLSPEGEFIVTRGKSSLNPVFPSHPQQNLLSAKITIPPYPSLSPAAGKIYNRPDLTGRIEPVRIEGYTMKEIGDLEKRLDRVEYYTKLSILEMEAANILFADENGVDRFKNGVIVDTFSGHNIGNVYNPDYKIAIDPVRGEARPAFKLSNLDLDYNSANSLFIQSSPNDATLTVTTNDTFTVGETITSGAVSGKLVYQVNSKLYLEDVSGTFSNNSIVTGGSSSSTGTISSISTPPEGKLLTMPYSHLEFIDQPYAAVRRNAAGFYWNFVGQITLSPDNDYWVDTTQAPDVQVNFDGNYDNWEQLADAWGTQWNDWQTIWSGTNGEVKQETYWVTQDVDFFGTQGGPSGITTTKAEWVKTITPGTTSLNTRQGTELAVSPVTNTQALGQKVVDVNLLPYMRSRVIQVTGKGFRPNTTLYGFFDGINISAYLTPTDSTFTATGSEGTLVSTDSRGDVYCLFRIPNDNTLKFRAGERKFRLTDSATNSVIAGLLTTAGETSYVAQGQTQTVENTIISTKKPKLDVTNLTDTTIVTTEGSIKSEPTGRTSTSRDGTNTSYRAPEIQESSDLTWDRLGRPYTFTPNQSTASVPFVTSEQWAAINSEITNCFLNGGTDPIAQTIIIKDSFRTGNPGVFLTKIDLFFAEKDPDRDVFVQLREVDPSGDVITSRVVPYSEITLAPEDINVSDDASAATPVTFSTPVFLRNNATYAIVIKPAANNPNVYVWASRIGEPDIASGERISKQPYAGVLFASSNDTTWTPIQEEDLKFKLYIAEFDGTREVSQAIFKQKDYDFFKIDAGSNTFSTIGDIIHGETTLSVTAYSNTQSLVGKYATGATSGATGIVTNVSGTDIKVKDVSVPAKFTTTEFVNFRSSNTTGTIVGNTTGTVVSTSTPTGTVEFFDNLTDVSNTYLDIINTGGTFTAGDVIKSQGNQRTARIRSVDKQELDIINFNVEALQFDLTALAGKGKFNTSVSARDSDYSIVEENETTTFRTPKYILSKSLENANLGQKSGEFALLMTSSTNRLSPAIDTDRVNVTIIDNTINNDSTGETNATGGNASAKYITRTMTLADGQDAEDLVVKFKAFKPSITDIKVYYKILNAEDSTEFGDRPWVEMSQSTLSSLYSDVENEDDLRDYEFTVPTSELTGPANEVQYTSSDGVTYTGFKYMAIKLVLLSSSEVIVPRVTKLVVVALQI